MFKKTADLVPVGSPNKDNLALGKIIPHICHGHKDGVRGEKICHVEKFQISAHDRCGEI